MPTDTRIRNAKPKDKPYKLPKECGLCLIINPNGSKWWRFSYIRQRGVEETARRAGTIIGQVFRYAIRRGVAEHDPTQGDDAVMGRLLGRTSR